MSNFKIDARESSWKFLDRHGKYANSPEGRKAGLKAAPLARQFKTAKEILARFQQGRGVLLADDVGLGKTTVAALVAWVVACQKGKNGKLMKVRIYAPNDVMRRHWAEELERHVPILKQFGFDVSNDRIKQGMVQTLKAGRIQVTTHIALVNFSKSRENSAERTQNSVRGSTDCDLMIIDEAHRAKGENSKFSKALKKFGGNAAKLILTATPFSINIEELERMLQFVGATQFKSVREYAKELQRLYSLGDGNDVATESERLEKKAKAAIEEELQPYVIRHGINGLSVAERKHFGQIANELDEPDKPWNIPSAKASSEELTLLLRMDRILKLTQKSGGKDSQQMKSKRRNDPRFHIGWQHFGSELEKVDGRTKIDGIARRHIETAKKALSTRQKKPHPKMDVVINAIRPVVEDGEKVLVFCHHHDIASELLSGLEKSLKLKASPRIGPSKKVWCDAWWKLANDNDWSTLGLDSDDANFDKDKAKNEHLIKSIIDWLCSRGLRFQIGGWLNGSADTLDELLKQLKKSRPRHAIKGPTIYKSAEMLAKALLDPQSKSTRTVLKNMSNGKLAFGHEASRFPGRLDDGFRVMGAWDHDKSEVRPKTLYTRKPDIVLTLFNSPFGPDVLVTTDRLSEGVDLHRCCRHLIHYELDPSPVRTIQRNGRIRRVGSWSALTGQPILYAYPAFGGTRDEKAVEVMDQRIKAFGALLGGVPTLDLDTDTDVREGSFAGEVLKLAKTKLEEFNRKLCVSSPRTRRAR